MDMFFLYWRNVWGILQELSPWLLIGALIAGLLHIFLPSDFIRKHLGKGSWRNVLKASLLGVPMPLCSCGVIPAVIGLKRDGASSGSAMGFLISTPQTGVDSITVSMVFLGLPFAVYKVFSAFITGIIGGVIVNFIEPVKEMSSLGRRQAEESRETCRNWRECGRQIFDFAINDLLYSVWKWIVVGVLVSAAITTFIPADALAGYAWIRGLGGMLLMLLIALPLYVCATASVPIVASLVVAGMPMGAALVFLMAGPATNVATLGAVSSQFGRRLTAVYLFVIAFFSVLFGWLFELLIGDYARPRQVVSGHLEEAGVAGALAMLVIFVYFIVRDLRFRRWQRLQEKNIGEERLELLVEGMTCAGCQANVRQAVMAQDGVERVDIDLEKGNVIVHGHSYRPECIRQAIEETGYEVKKIVTEL